MVPSIKWIIKKAVNQKAVSKQFQSLTPTLECKVNFAVAMRQEILFFYHNPLGKKSHWAVPFKKVWQLTQAFAYKHLMYLMHLKSILNIQVKASHYLKHRFNTAIPFFESDAKHFELEFYMGRYRQQFYPNTTRYLQISFTFYSFLASFSCCLLVLLSCEKIVNN